MNVVRHDLDLVCHATDIPDHIDIDLAGHGLGDVIKISSLTLPKGVTPADTSRDFTIASISAPRRVLEEAPAAAEGEAAEGAEKAAEDDKKE